MRGIGIGVGRIGGSKVPAPTATLTAPVGAASFVRETAVTITVTFDCANATSVEVFADVDGAGAVSWGSDSSVSGGSGSITRIIQPSDVGTVVSLVATATGLGGSTNSTAVVITVTELGYTTTDFSAYDNGAGVPSGWTERWGTSTWTIVADAGYTGGKYLSQVGDATANALASWNEADNLDNVDIICRSMFSGTSLQSMVVARGSGSGATLTGYRLGYDDSDEKLYLARVVNGAVTKIGEKDGAINDVVLFWIRLQVQGSALKGKHWTGALGDEPAAWDIETTDGGITTGDWCGLGALRATSYRRFDLFGYKPMTAAAYMDSEIPDQTQAADFNAFGNMIELANGSWFVVYRKGSTHVYDGDYGEIWGATSTDGYTWGTEYQIHADALYDLRDPCVMQMADGNLLISFFKYDVDGTTAPIPAAVHVIKAATPAGAWTEYDACSTFTEYEACSAPVVQLADGTLLLPLRGRDTGDTIDSSRVMKSTNGGTTWTELAIIAEGVRHYQEPSLCVLDDGDVLCLMRTGTTVYAAVSGDDGATWGAPYSAYDGVGAPRVTQWSGVNGRLVTNYRSNTDDETAYRTSTDRGATWSDETIVSSTGSSHQYGSFSEVSANIGALCFWRKQSGSESRGYVKHIAF